MELWMISAAICAVLSAVVASSKDRSGFGWFLLGLIFGVFALLFVACLPAIKSQPKRFSDPTPLNVADKVCPNCAETIKRDALVCRYCDVEFVKPDTPSDVRRQRIVTVVAALILGYIVFALFSGN